MPDTTRIVAPGPSPGTVLTQDGQVLRPPADWDLLPPGDAGLTRRVKAAGPTWTVQTKRGRKLFSQGVWAPARHIERARLSIETARETPAYQRKREAGVEQGPPALGRGGDHRVLAGDLVGGDRHGGHIRTRERACPEPSGPPTPGWGRMDP